MDQLGRRQMQAVMPRDDNKATQTGRLVQFARPNALPDTRIDLRGYTHRNSLWFGRSFLQMKRTPVIAPGRAWIQRGRPRLTTSCDAYRRRSGSSERH